MTTASSSPSPSLHAQAVGIKDAVSSIARCSQSTVSTLNDLLFPADPIPTPPAKAKSTRNHPPSTKALSGSKRARAGPPPKTAKSSKIAPQIIVLEVPSDVPAVLAPRERFVLATEVVNASLKTLTDAVKSPSAVTRPPTAKDGPTLDRVAAGPKRLLRTASVPTLALHPRALNRVSSSPASSPRTSRASSTSTQSLGALAIAACARLAFSCLRALQAKSLSGIDLPALQVENGMSALIGKLVALGFDDLAVKEIRILKRRLEGEHQAPPGHLSKDQTSATKDTLATLLRWKPSQDTAPAVSLVVATQMQVLKLIASTKKPATIHAILDHLAPSSPGSPAHLILASLEPSTAAKAAQRLASLSHILFSLAPSIASAEDEVASNPKMSSSPEVSLHLHCLALHHRLLWWKAAHHQADPVKDVLEPFSRCLNAFTRRSTLDVSKKYELVKTRYEDLVDQCNKYGQVLDPPSTAGPSPWRAVFRQLAALSQEASCLADAMDWIAKTMKTFDSQDRSSASRVSCAARLASIVIQRSPADLDEDAITLLEGMSATLTDNLRGEVTELDALLVEVSCLRHAAARYVTAIRECNTRTRGTVTALILSCLRFFDRYLGTVPSAKDPAKAILQYEQRRKTVEPAALASVESICAVCKIALAQGEMTWTELDGALQNCADVMARICPAPTADPADNVQSGLVKASNLYWLFYLRSQKAASSADSSDALRAMQRAVDLTRTLSPVYSRAALSAVKLDRLGCAYEARGRYDDAAEAFLGSIQSQLQSGVARDLVEDQTWAPPRTRWEAPGNSVVLGRTLAAWMRASFKGRQAEDDTPCFFDDPTGDRPARSAMLEWQVELVAGMLQKTSKPRKYQSTLLALSDRLLQLHSAHEYPLRRSRVLARLLRLFVDHAVIVPSEVMALHQGEATSLLRIACLGRDTAHARYQDHLRASLSVSVALTHNRLDVETLQEPVAIWLRLVDAAPSWDLLGDVIDDIPLCLSLLSSIAGFYDLKGLPHLRIPVLQLSTRIRELQVPMDQGPLLADRSALGLEYLRLGYSDKAGTLLSHTPSNAQLESISTTTLVRWHLANAEYLVAIGEVDRCIDTLNRAKALAEELGVADNSSSVSTTSRVSATRLAAEAHLIASRAALEKGSASRALAHAKTCVRLNYRAWAGLESQAGVKAASAPLAVADPELDATTSGMASMALSGAIPHIKSTTHDALNGAAFWTLVSPLHRGLGNLSELFAHHGMFQEAIYYTQQAQKVVEAVDATSRIVHSLAVAGHLWTRGGQMASGTETLDQAQGLVRECALSQASVLLHCWIGNLHRQQGSEQLELAAYLEAEKALDEISTHRFIEGLERFSTPADELRQQMATLAIDALPPPRRARPGASARGRKAQVSRTGKNVSSRPVPEATRSSIEPAGLARLRGMLLRLKALAMTTRRNCESARGLLADAACRAHDQQGLIDQHIVTTKHLLQQSLDQMSANAVFCVLRESTISFPSAAMALRAEKSPGSVTRHSPPRPSPVKTGSRRTAQAAIPAEDFIDLLRQGRDHVTDVLALALRSGSTSAIHQISSALSGVIMLLAAASPGKTHKVVHPAMAVYAMEIARTLSLRREERAIQLEKQARDRTSGISWPGPEDASVEVPMDDWLQLDASRFQKKFIDIIPPSWTAVSISLSEARDELYISKVRAGHTPFVLRLPLDRHHCRDADEEVFNFDQGRSELGEIIDLANFSAHDARDMSRSGAKSQWWAEREALDARLRHLLVNMENIWLGGFRGIFSQASLHPDLLARFQRAFQAILDKYLPSRQKADRRNRASRVTLDPRILELFVGLGLSSEECDLEETLTDLLYFVVDVLQFHGERNAYDEIDFDSLVVETQDALERYHDAARSEPALHDRPHTILILDKALHSIPWESLPCMNGLSVSRMPSLGCLRERILAQGSKPHADASDGVHVDAANGAYVLNPGGDLTATQGVFEGDLRRLRGWSGIVQREPSESEMRTSLESRDLFLYFGHGSGAQYIRARTIKKLDRCAVALLMGCSSGTLTDTGEFEPYGTPINYTHARCPALVATLWDVTDKDIDRFSHAALKRWGLIPSSSTYPTSSTSKGRSKEKARTQAMKKDGTSPSPEPAGPFSLVEAVAEGRKACILRYLNGAAPVVYGIPVYLTQG
ncbi:MAG: hypothetical protein M1838_000709 [Thelocarpon superellum]|nr:MAG: hypothetical protein M1838_000709 [Thelocarpon superellum]